MGQALYRKYRSKKLSEIVGQEHITTTLENAIKNDQLSHAYLLTGPRGVGKTSVARILAHEINNLPYDDDSQHLDIIEIDAASNRRIDEIRELRDKVNLAPTSAKYKVYIIDEVHMLTREAFNALLKTLEEPPEHVIFILATTESYKVPETISSRTQQFNFKPIPISQLVKQLKNIAKSEKISIDDEAVHLIAEYGQGSFRDSIGLLDQISSSKSSISVKDVQKLLGMAPDDIINNIIEALKNSLIVNLSDQFSVIYDGGYNITMLCKQLSDKLRGFIVSNEQGWDQSRVLELMRQLIDVPASNDPYDAFEIALLGYVLGGTNQNLDDNVKQDNGIDATTRNPKVNKKIEVKAPEKITKINKVEKIDFSIWDQILKSLQENNNTLYGVARIATPEFSEGVLTLKSRFPFHQRKLSESKSLSIITETVKKITGQNIKIECIVVKDLKPLIDENDTETEAEPIDGSLSTISNIFGGAEVLE